MENKISKVLDYIIERKDEQAKAELKKILQNHPKYLAYRKTLDEMGLSFSEVEVPEVVYLRIEEALKDFHPNAQKKIIDKVYIDICQKQN